MTLEVGKPFVEAKGEVGGAADIFEWNAEETKRIYGQTVESRFEDTRVHVYYQPVGVVAALTPWNFPAVLSARKISTALAAGCSVIVKPDVITPGIVMEMVDILLELLCPQICFQLFVQKFFLFLLHSIQKYLHHHLLRPLPQLKAFRPLMLTILLAHFFFHALNQQFF